MAGIDPETRVRVQERDQGLCRYCGASNVPMTIDHLVPVSRGGSNRMENLVLACEGCNGEKGHKAPEAVGLRLLASGERLPEAEYAAVRDRRIRRWQKSKRRTRYDVMPDWMQQ